MSEAYVETTVLTDVLLKPGSEKQAIARAALARYDSTSLPVYSIKEWKNGPLSYFAYLHDKLVSTKSIAKTFEALSALRRQTYRLATSLEALAAAQRLSNTVPIHFSGLGDTDEAMADCYRVALELLIFKSWHKRRKLTKRVVGDLACYTEAPPMLRKTGLIDLAPKQCDVDEECCLAAELKSRPDLLAALRDAIPPTSTRSEDVNRRKVLRQLVKHPNEILDRNGCRQLGDAIFAFFCPENACVLTSNLKDHLPLTKAIGKTAEAP